MAAASSTHFIPLTTRSSIHYQTWRHLMGKLLLDFYLSIISGALRPTRKTSMPWDETTTSSIGSATVGAGRISTPPGAVMETFGFAFHPPATGDHHLPGESTKNRSTVDAALRCWMPCWSYTAGARLLDAEEGARERFDHAPSYAGQPYACDHAHG